MHVQVCPKCGAKHLGYEKVWARCVHIKKINKDGTVEKCNTELPGLQEKSGRKCGICGKPGHNKRTCPNGDS